MNMLKHGKRLSLFNFTKVKIPLDTHEVAKREYK